MRRLLLILLILTGQFAWAQFNPSTVLFGVEYTFQDREMVNEPGRSTLSTPYKEAKVREVVENLRRLLELPPSAVEVKTSWKPGLYLRVPGDGAWVINSEPVTIEINTPPRRIDQLVETAQPIFEATRRAGLRAYVQPAAERSGMGHIHIGARNMAENPFFANPLLLRNVMVYLHKRPSLLHGFAEAFDIGIGSNIETYHEEARQRVFERVVTEFDRWYLSASEGERQSQGFNKFLGLLAHHDSALTGFFEHYRFLNLEHVKEGTYRPFQPTDTGKLTVEFRNFRPPKDPETTRAFAELLMAIMERQSREGHREVFEWVPAERYHRFNTASVVRADWERTRAELGLNIPQLDQQIREYTAAVERFTFISPRLPGARVFLSHSRKDDKGRLHEIRIPTRGQGQPELRIGEQVIEMEWLFMRGRGYWTGVLDLSRAGVSLEDIRSGRAESELRWRPLSCARALGF